METNTKKIVLFIVEGKTDKKYLYGLKKELKKHYSNEEYLFDVINGDLLSDSDLIVPIDDYIKLNVDTYLSDNKCELSDLIEIIHIIDADGIYIDDKKCVKNIVRDKFFYSRTTIECKSKERIERRNRWKRETIETRLKTTKEEFKSSDDKLIHSVNYSIYFVSTNMDDLFFGEQNFSEEEKNIHSLIIMELYKRNPSDYFKVFFDYRLGNDYYESWSLLKENNNSLERNNNIIFLIKDKLGNLQ